MIPYSRPNSLIYIPYSRDNQENHTLHSGTYLQSPYIAVALPPAPLQVTDTLIAIGKGIILITPAYPPTMTVLDYICLENKNGIACLGDSSLFTETPHICWCLLLMLPSFSLGCPWYDALQFKIAIPVALIQKSLQMPIFPYLSQFFVHNSTTRSWAVEKDCPSVINS